jgi:hypothetical protein
MRWVIVATAAAVGAVIAANALLLVFGTNRHDPVGRLSPIAAYRPSHVVQPSPAARTARVREWHREDD